MVKQKPTGFADQLRRLREAAGITQEQLAERAGMHKFGIAKLERGEREPAWATVLMLADALGVECTEFKSTAGAEPPEQRPRGRPTKPKPEPSAPKRPRGRPRKEK